MYPFNFLFFLAKRKPFVDFPFSFLTPSLSGLIWIAGRRKSNDCIGAGSGRWRAMACEPLGGANLSPPDANLFLTQPMYPMSH